MSKPGNTYEEAAVKLGMSVRTLSTWVSRRRIAVIILSHTKRFITDEEIQRIITKRTRKAII